MSTSHRSTATCALPDSSPPNQSKKPSPSYIRFEADQPNETWQSDFTHYRLSTGVDVEIITWLDDHSRYALSITAHLRVTGPIVLDTFRTACAEHGKPASTLTDNGMVYTTRFAGGTGGRNTFETELVNHRIVQKNSRPNHPTTCGKVERFQQTLKNWLRAQPPTRHHQRTPNTPRHLHRRSTTTTAHTAHCHTAQPRPPPTHARPKATPGDTSHHAHYRVRHDRVTKPAPSPCATTADSTTSDIGKQHAGTYVVLLIDDLHVRVIDADTGEVLRDLTLDPTKRLPRHRQTTRTTTRNQQRPDPHNAGPDVSDVSRHHIGGGGRI